MSKLRGSFIQVSTFFLVLFVHAVADAAHTEWTESEPARARLIYAEESLGDRLDVKGVVQVELEEGWHTYWKAPGDAGLPPRFDWSKSTNLERADIFWPAPLAFAEAGFKTYGYQHSVDFPFVAHWNEASKDSQLDLTLNLMVCKEICIPQTLTFTMDIPAGEAERAPLWQYVEDAHSALPSRENLPDLKIRNAVISKEAVVIGAYAKDGLENTDIFVAIDSLALTNQPKLGLDKQDPRQGLIVIDRPDDIDDLNAYAAGKSVDVVLVQESRSVHQVISLPPAKQGEAQ